MKEKENFDISYEITQHYGIVYVNPKSKWTRELNMVSWNGKAAKFDLRDWGPGHEKMGKGISFTEQEAIAIRDLLQKVL